MRNRRIPHYFSTITALAENYQLTSWLFIRLLALIYFSAFFSLAIQITGLAGENGILPFHQLLDALYQQHGSAAWWKLPTLFWIDSSDLALQGAAYTGCAVSLLLLFGIRQQLSLILLFLLYLSLQLAGQVFLNFQWDYLLLESGFLAILLIRGPTHLVIFLFHWLLFRLRFLSGISKLLSADPSWSGLTALNYYFETQPLPHIGSWYAQQLPGWLLQGGVIFTLFAELIVPFFIFMPRRFRLFAAATTILLQLIIIATSNHNFINLLTIILCLFLLDDSIVRRFFPSRLRSLPIQTGSTTGGLHRPLTLIAAFLIFSISLPLGYSLISGQQLPATLRQWAVAVRIYGIGNVYHVFPTMQTERHELQIEGSMDGKEWKPYLFRYKPGPLERKPPFIIPHQPRLDWMVWFVPTQSPRNIHWFNRFMHKLWEGSPEVTGLLEESPFSEKPPRYLRTLVYRYQFTTHDQKQQRGDYWKRAYLGEFPNVRPRQP